MTAVLGSCASILSLLQEDDDQLKIAALNKLNEPGVVEMYWTEIADYLAHIEVLHEDPSFAQNKLAALVAAKVYYHLDESNDALRLALRAGDLFNVTDSESAFVRAIIAYCVDKYIATSVKAVTKQQQKTPAAEDDDAISTDDSMDGSAEDSEEDKAAIAALIQNLHDNCVIKEELTYALGVAFESLDLNKVEAILIAAPAARQSELLSFCLEQAPRVISNKQFRTDVLQVVSKRFQTLANFDATLGGSYSGSVSAESDAALLQYVNGLANAFLRLNDAAAAANLFSRLSNAKDTRLHIAAIQVAFDLYLADQTPFLSAIVNVLNPPKAEGEAEEVALEQSPESERLARIVSILQGADWARVSLQLLAKNNKTDLNILDRLKAEPGAIAHNALVISHAFAQAGTTNDAFLRVNIDWLGKAQCWNKFTATASMGVVHAGHSEGRKVLSKYLPPEGATGEDATAAQRSAYAEAGAFYALGLIHSKAPNTPEAVAVRAYLLQQLKDNHTSEIRLHGACLGIGLLSVGIADATIYEALKAVLYTDMAVAGEAAALSIGLLMQGSMNQEAIEALHAYSHESPHEKIVRACALALGLVVFKREEEAEPLLNTLAADQDAAIRYGAVMACGMAYAGTSSLAAQRRLLKTSVSDVSEDVRRGAIVALGFILADRPHKVAESLKLICENYSFQVRYGAALALGIGCAGTFNKDAVDLLVQLRSDQHDVVRQAAGIALGLVLMNATDAHGPKVAQVREDLLKAATDRKETAISKMGASIGIGLMNAAGRNGTTGFIVTAPSTASSSAPSVDGTAPDAEVTTGQVRYHTAAGLFLMSQLWYWFPLAICGSLAVRPSLLVGITEDVKVPAGFEVRCVAQKEKLAYPAALKREEKEKLEKTSTAILSVSNKKIGKSTEEKIAEEAAAAAKKSGMDVEVETPAQPIPAASPVLTAQGNVTRKYEVLANGSRVLPAVTESIVFVHNSTARFVPLFATNPATHTSLAATSAPIRKVGPIVLVDTKPDQGEFDRLDNPPTPPPSATGDKKDDAADVVAPSNADLYPTNNEARVPIPEDFEWDGN